MEGLVDIDRLLCGCFQISTSKLNSLPYGVIHADLTIIQDVTLVSNKEERGTGFVADIHECFEIVDVVKGCAGVDREGNDEPL
jgi:hypothetical protein